MTTATVSAFDAHIDSLAAAQRDGAGPDSAVRAAWESAVLDAEIEASHHADALHNGLMQCLVVLRHALARERGPAGAAARPDDTAATMPDPDRAVQICLAETRSLVWHLRPRVCDGDGLDRALEDLAVRLGADGGPTLHHQVHAAGLSRAQAVVAFRLVQERARAAGPGETLRARVLRTKSGAVVVDVSGPAYDDAGVWTARGAHLDVHLASTGIRG